MLSSGVALLSSMIKMFFFGHYFCCFLQPSNKQKQDCSCPCFSGMWLLGKIKKKHRAKGILWTIALISAPGFQEQVELDVVGVNGEANARTAQLFGGLVNPFFYSDVGAVLFGCPRDDLRRLRKNLKSKPNLWNTVRNYQNKSVSTEVCLLVRLFVCYFLARSFVFVCLYRHVFFSLSFRVWFPASYSKLVFFMWALTWKHDSVLLLLLHAMGVAVLCEVAISASKPSEKQFWRFSCLFSENHQTTKTVFF